MKGIKRIAVIVSGGTVLILGIALIVLPGPAFIMIPAGLAILVIEFAWARRWLLLARTLLPVRSRDTILPNKNEMQRTRRGRKQILSYKHSSDAFAE